MRVHVAGVGAVGTLVAAHLRAAVRRKQKALSLQSDGLRPHDLFDPRTTGITLHLRDRRYAEAPQRGQPGGSVTVERDGVRMTESGFAVELRSALGASATRVMKADAQGILTDAPPSAGGDSIMEAQNDGARDESAIDSLFVTTKADSTVDAVGRLADRLTPSSTIVLLQNGMGVLDMLLEQLFRDPTSRPNIILATMTHGCYTRRPLHVVHAGFGSLHFGIVPDARTGLSGFEQAAQGAPDKTAAALDVSRIADEPSTRTLRATVELLLDLPLDVCWEPIRAYQLRALRKLIINACINPITALADCKNGDLFGSLPASELLRALCAEGSQVLEAHAREAKVGQGVSAEDAGRLSSLPLADLLTQTDAQGLPLLDASLKPASLLHEVENVVRATASNWSSMHQDLRNRRQSTEIDFINGYLVELGRAYGIPTPANEVVANLVRLKSRRLTGTWRSRTNR